MNNSNIFLNIPEELRTRSQWVNWRGQLKADGSISKEPFIAGTNDNASSTNPNTWRSFDSAVASIGHLPPYVMSGIMYCFAPDDPYVGFDLDDISSSDKLTNEQRKDILNRQKYIFDNCQTYTEYSPSGKGLHLIGRGKIPRGIHPKGIGIFSEARFFTFTGNILRNLPIINCQTILDELVTSAPVNDNPMFSDQIVDDQRIIDALIANDKATRLACGEWRDEYPSQSEADQALLNIIAFHTSNREQIERIFKNTRLYRPDRGVSYLNRSIVKAMDRKVKDVDFSALANPLELPVEEEIVGDNPYIKNLPGLLGEIATFIYRASPRPVPEISLAAAISFMAGICGRCYNVSGTGLNLYTLLLAPTGRGKEAMAGGIERLTSAVREFPGVSSIDEFRGPGDIASGQAIARHMADGRNCFLSIVGEFGLRLQQLSHPRANPAEHSLKRYLLDLFNKSGRGNVVRPTIYSDSQKNTKPTYNPSFSLLGESVPSKFYDSISEDMIGEGLLPRFLIIEYNGPRPALNPTAGFERPTNSLIDGVKQLASYALGKNANNQILDVLFNEAAQNTLDEFNIKCDNLINGTNNDVIAQLWNRAHIKALKLASIMAVGECYHSPIVTDYAAKWAIDIVEFDIKKLVKKFEKGEVGPSMTGEERMIMDTKRLIREYYTLPWSKIKSYSPFENMYIAGYIPERYLSKRISGIASFRKSNVPPSKALEQILKTLVSHDVLMSVPEYYMQQQFNTRTKSYYLRDRTILNPGS